MTCDAADFVAYYCLNKADPAAEFEKRGAERKSDGSVRGRDGEREKLGEKRAVQRRVEVAT